MPRRLARSGPADSRTLDALIAQSIARPDRNITGAVGPRCPTCSGLGAYLRLGSAPDHVTRAVTRCTCDGSGLDLGLLERADRELLWQQIHKIESQLQWPLTSRYRLPPVVNSRQTWMECVYWLPSDATAVANTVTETILVPNVTIPAGYLAGGRLLRLKFQGKWSTTTGTVSHIYSLRWGGVAGTVLCKTGTVTLLVSITNALFTVEALIQTRTDDATGGVGVLYANGEAVAYAGTAPTIGSATGAPAVAPMTNGGQLTPAQVGSLTLNADTALSLTVTHGAASASNTVTGQLYSVESMN